MYNVEFACVYLRVCVCVRARKGTSVESVALKIKGERINGRSEERKDGWMAGK